MITKKSYARITLALDIIRKLPNDYHLLNIIKQRINLYDVIKVSESEETELICSNKEMPLDESNLVMKVVMLVKERFNIEKNVRIEIEKNIPIKAGLAGGSSNAATMFMILNELWGLNLSREELVRLSKEIGMDVGFFFFNGSVFDTESKELVYEVKPGLDSGYVLIVTPEFGVSTKEAYSLLNLRMTGKRIEETQKMIDAIKQNDLKSVVESMHNDFEDFVFEKYPRLREIKENLLGIGSLNVLMTGSGSTLFAVFKNKEELDNAYEEFKDEFKFVFKTELKE